MIVLEKAIAAIDGEIETAKKRADEAAAKYKQLRETAEERKTAMQAKIDALGPSPHRDGPGDPDQQTARSGSPSTPVDNLRSHTDNW